MLSIVMGPACSGKSTFIRKEREKGNLPGRIIDIYDFQKPIRCINVESIKMAQEQCENEVCAALRRGEDVVLEHTLLKKNRRTELLQAVRKVYGTKCFDGVRDGIVNLYYMYPDVDVYQERINKRSACLEADAKEMLDFLEIPDSSEDVDNIFCIKE